MVEENAITADTTWKDLKRSIEEEDAYKAMEGQPGGARDVFDDIVAELRRQVKALVPFGHAVAPNCYGWFVREMRLLHLWGKSNCDPFQPVSQTTPGLLACSCWRHQC